MIDFEKYGKQKSTTPGGEVIDWNKYGASLSPVAGETAPKAFKYDVPETRTAKLSRYQEEARKAEEEAKRLNSPLERFVRPISDAILPGTAQLGDTIGGIINTNKLTDTYQTAQHNLSTTQFDLIRKINRDRKAGKDTTNLEQLYNEGVDQLAQLEEEYNRATGGAQKTSKQVSGEIGMTALNALLFGTYGKATQGMKMGSLAVEGPVSALVAKSGIPSNVLKQSSLPSAISKVTGLVTKPSSLFSRDGLKNVALGTGIGEAFDITQNLQEDKSGLDILTGGYAKYIGGAFPALIEGSKSISNKFSKQLAREELGNAYRDTIGKYTRTQTILDNAERVNKTDPISIFKMYGKETVPTMTSNGRVDPSDQIAFLENKIKELSEIKSDAIFLNDNLVTADEYKKYIDGLIDAQRSWTEGKKLAEKKQAAKIFDEIASAQGDKPFEMSTIDKIKTEQTGLSKSYKNPNAAFSYDAHGIIGKASRDLVEMFSDDVAVRDLNKLIQGHYDAIDILGALKGKTPKGGMMSKHFGRISGQLLGYGAGNAIGQPFLGMAAGQIISNEISGIIQSNFITNPLKRLLINNLKEQAPREVSSVLKSMEAKYGEIFDELGLVVGPKGKEWKPGMPEKMLPPETGDIPPETYIKQGLREGKELGRIILDYAKDIKNKGGLSIRDVSRETPKSGYRVGLSAVKGRIRQDIDALAETADALIKEGKFEEAQKYFDKITTQAQKTIRDRFRGTGIEIKMEGTGFGVYKGTPEPNLDFTAIVTPDKEDLFHQILSDIANKDFLQESFLTHKPVQSDAVIGMMDKAKGIRNEPYITMTFKKPLEIKDISEINQALEDVGLEAMTLREGGNKLDLVHLTEYNGDDYERWIKQTNDFRKNLERKGLLGDVQQGISQTRFIGSESSGATTTYKRNTSNFYSKNKDYINPDINSKVLDAIKYRKEISKGELESIVNAGDISPTEKTVFKEVLESLKDGKIKTKEIQNRLRGKLLTLEPKVVDKYASYGFDNLDTGSFDKYKSIVFDSNLKHGQGKGHFDAEGMFGHARYAVDETDGIVSIGEIQSDVFQDSAKVQNIKNFFQKQLETEKMIIERNQEYIRANEEKIKLLKDRLSGKKLATGSDLKSRKYLPDEIEEMKREIVEYELNLDANKNAIKDSEMIINELSDASKATDKQLLIDQFVNFSRKDKYRDRLLQETINFANKTEKPKEIRIATPSTVAKIEGFVGGDDFAPYQVIEGGNGRVGRGAEDLTYGDIIDYGGEEMMVVDVQAQGRGWGGPPPTAIVVAPKDRVNNFSFNAWLDDEINYKTEEAMSELKKAFPEEGEITPEQLQKFKEDGIDNWDVEKVTEEITEPITFEELQTKIEDRIRDYEYENGWENLKSIYGDDNVFGREVGKGHDTDVYVVEDGVSTESFGQPDSYTANIDNISDIDTNRQEAENILSKDQMGVLENYYKIQEEFIPKLEKIIGKKIENIEDGSGNTWWKIDPEDLKKTQFGSAPIGVLVAGAALTGAGALAMSGSKETYNKTAEAKEEKTYKIPDRSVEITEKDIEEFAPILFGEISNRSDDKLELEARVILNTAINRVKQLKGKKTLEEVLKQPNQYQAYGSDEYKKYFTGDDAPTKSKKEKVDKIIEKLTKEIEDGTFKDNTNGAVFYKHNKDGSITYDSTKKLIK